MLVPNPPASAGSPRELFGWGAGSMFSFVFYFSSSIFILFCCCCWHFENLPNLPENLTAEYKKPYTLYPDSVIHFTFCPISFNILYVRGWHTFSGKGPVVTVLGFEGYAVSLCHDYTALFWRHTGSRSL